MDSLSSNVILPPHNFASLAGDVLSKLKNSQCDKDRGQQGLPQTLFRRQYGNAWVTVLREPSGKIKGYLEDLKKQKRTLDIKGIPTQLDSNHIENATVLLENSHLFLTDYEINILLMLKGGMKGEFDASSNQCEKSYSVALKINAEGSTPLHSAVKNDNSIALTKLLEESVDIEALDEKGLTPLYWAVKKENLSAVIKLLEKNANTEVKDEEGLTPLHWVVRQWESNILIRILVKLLEKNANIEAQDKKGLTPLYWAVQKGNLGAVVKLLEKNANTEVKDEEGLTPLHCAVKQRELGILEKLLEKNANIEAQDGERLTPLYWAARQWEPNVLEKLLERNANTEVKDKEGLTPLHWAVKNRNLNVLEKLLEKNTSTEVRDEKGLTPLHWAATQWEPGILAKLLEKNANIEAQDKKGLTPLYWAVQKGNLRAVVKLLEKNANTEVKNEEGMTLVHWAISNNDPGILAKLLEKNANVEMQDKKGLAPLHWAIKKESLSAVTKLLKQNVNTETQDEAGLTPLHWAVRIGNLSILAELLEKNPDTKIQDKTGLTPLQWALKNSNSNTLVRLLEKKTNTKVQRGKKLTPSYRSAGNNYMNNKELPITDAANQAIVNRSLQNLDLSNWPNLTDQTLVKNLLNNKRIVGLNLKGCTQLTDKSLSYIVQNYSEIESLDLTQCTGITDKGINSALDILFLKKIILDNHPGIKPETIKRLSRRHVEFSVTGLKSQDPAAFTEHKGLVKKRVHAEDVLSIADLHDNALEKWAIEQQRAKPSEQEVFMRPSIKENKEVLKIEEMDVLNSKRQRIERDTINTSKHLRIDPAYNTINTKNILSSKLDNMEEMFIQQGFELFEILNFLNKYNLELNFEEVSFQSQQFNTLGSRQPISIIFWKKKLIDNPKSKEFLIAGKSGKVCYLYCSTGKIILLIEVPVMDSRYKNSFNDKLKLASIVEEKFNSKIEGLKNGRLLLIEDDFSQGFNHSGWGLLENERYSWQPGLNPLVNFAKNQMSLEI